MRGRPSLRYRVPEDRLDDALHRATIAFADELRIGGLSDDMAWRAADRAIGAASDFLAREVRL